MCMCMSKLMPLLAIVPIALLLTLSFVVLLLLRKVEEKGLKAFGYVVVSFLWLASLMVFAGAMYRLGQGPQMMGKCMMQSKMMGSMMKMPVSGAPMSMAMPQNDTLAKDGKNNMGSKCSGNKGVISKK